MERNEFPSRLGLRERADKGENGNCKSRPPKHFMLREVVKKKGAKGYRNKRV